MDRAYDIVVVGGGGAGLMAALSAAGHGRKVALIEKNETLGGTTALSVGSICTTSTPHQRAMGIDDGPDAHFEDMALFAGPLQARDNLELRRLLVDETPETFRMLCATGIEFMGPMPEPPHRQPRLHAIVPHSRGYVHHLSRAARRLGADIRCRMRAANLIRENGRIAGVAARGPDGETTVFRARRAVILAAGDFSAAAAEYKGRFLDRALMDVQGINPASTGDGQQLGEAVGGRVVNGDIVWGPEIRFVAPPRDSAIARMPPNRIFARAILLAMRTLPDAVLRPFLMSFVTTFLAPSPTLFEQGPILVNTDGERFTDERDRPQDAISRQPGGDAYYVFDDTIAKRFEAWPNFVSTAPGVGYAYLSDYRRSRKDIVHRGDTPQELARGIGCPPDALARTIAAHNEAAGDGMALRQPPYHALGPARSWIVFGEGGLAVDTDLRVLDDIDTPIPGLYAAGSCGQGGVILNGHGHHLGWAFTSGRLAGRNAALS